MTKNDKIAELEKRIAELELTIERNQKWADGIQGNVDKTKEQQEFLLWAFGSMQNGFEPGPEEWRHIEHNVAQSVFHLLCIQALVSDIKGETEYIETP